MVTMQTSGAHHVLHVCHIQYITVCYRILRNLLIFSSEFHYLSNVKFVLICLHLSQPVPVETRYIRFDVHHSSLYNPQSEALNPVAEFQAECET
jgi:hypothetical protein